MVGLISDPSAQNTLFGGPRIVLSNPYEIPCEGNEPTLAARQAIDQALADIEVTKESLLKARNRLSSIYVLPPKVLSKIFILIRDSSSNPRMPSQHPTHWIRLVGHICHHWREVALNCATLWSSPILTNPELAQEMLRRSKQAALTIQLTNGAWTARMLSGLESAMTQMSRIRILRLTCGSHSDRIHKLFDAFSQPAPHLEKLTLTSNVYALQNSYLLPDNVFADAPRLQSVELDRFKIPWTLAVFKYSLTNLNVNSSYAQEHSTFTQLFEALAHMPKLQTLRLAKCIPSHTTANGNEPILDFPALRSLEIESKAIDCIRFLRRIKYPPHTLIKLFCTSLTKVDDYINLFAFASKNQHEANIPSTTRVFRSASFTLNSDRELRIYLYSRSDAIIPQGLLGSRGSCDVTLQFFWDAAHEISFCNVLRELHRLFDLNSLEALEFDWFHRDCSIESIRETIGKLPILSYLRMGSLGSRQFQAIRLSSDSVPTTEGGRGKANGQEEERFKSYSVVNFPALKTLYLEGLDLHERRSPGTLNDLMNTLEYRRRNINSPIGVLELKDCSGVRIEQKRQLDELVNDLLVDGELVDVEELDSEDEIVTSEEELDEGVDEADLFVDDDDYFVNDTFYTYGYDLG